MSFGYVSDNDESLKGKEFSNLNFGLNHGFITKFEYNPNAGKDGAPADAIDIEVTSLEGKTVKSRIYDVGDVYNADNVKIGPLDEGYENVAKVERAQKSAVITHFVKALGVTEETIIKALTPAPKNFAEYAQIMTSLVAKNYSSIPVDFFVQYQWSIKGDAKMTYLELPKNMKDGYFIVPSIKPNGEWKEVRNEKGLSYVDNVGNIHPITKSKNFLESNKAKQQKKDETAATFALMNQSTPTISGW
ncbi:MAG TPA: hypothetical protein PLN85_01495 [archaeon]|nr:hypothetical protein [archaeon]HRT02629.1 hypothetical protein [Candidatus Diapherotrites archaeon]